MRLTLDLTGSHALRDDLDLLHDAQNAVIDLLTPGGHLDPRARDRLATLLRILADLHAAARAARASCGSD